MGAMTTFRLLGQTGRCSRYAQVTVEVAASSRLEVEVTATGVLDEHRREAELGARWALPGAATVTVTDVRVTEIDTGVGDVYEATARAVQLALRVDQPKPYAGFSDPGMVASWLTEMCGQRLVSVTEARYWSEGRREPDAESLLHAWLQFERAWPIGLHGRGDQLLLAKEKPYPSSDMEQDGRIVVGPARSPDVLRRFVGSRLSDGAVILGHDGDAVGAGLVLRFDTGDLVAGTLGDEWVLAAGPVPAVAARSWAVRPFVRGSR